MPDDPFYLPNRTIPPQQSRPGERLWSLRKDGDEIDCQLRYHGEWGVEAQFFRRGEFWNGRRFDTRALAVQWAELEREALRREGWLSPCRCRHGWICEAHPTRSTSPKATRTALSVTVRGFYETD